MSERINIGEAWDKIQESFYGSPKQTTMKKYVLLKHLPACNAGTEFLPDNRGKGGYENDINDGQQSYWLPAKVVEHSPQWFSEVKPERIEIEIVFVGWENNGIASNYKFTSPRMLLDKKMDEVKEAIERVLNDEYNNLNGAFLDIERKKAFNAAREREGIPKIQTGPPPYLKYDTFQDYLNSIKQP